MINEHEKAAIAPYLKSVENSNLGQSVAGYYYAYVSTCLADRPGGRGQLPAGDSFLDHYTTHKPNWPQG